MLEEEGCRAEEGKGEKKWDRGQLQYRKWSIKLKSSAPFTQYMTFKLSLSFYYEKLHIYHSQAETEVES